jgi:hypothetical protein
VDVELKKAFELVLKMPFIFIVPVKTGEFKGDFKLSWL